MRKLLLGTAAAAVLAAPLAGTASAGDTTVTFSVNAGALSISNAASAALSNATVNVLGTSVSGTLGDTTVSDLRGLAAGGWTVTVSSTDFTAGAGKTIAKAQGSMYSGASTASTGTVVFVPTTALTSVSLGASATLATATGVLGSASVTYNPTLTVSIPGSTQAGDYSGTVTQTVA